jgi:hypothetical protein
MNSNVKERFCCITCRFFSDNISNIKRHLLTEKHLTKLNSISNICIDQNCKYQCKVCDKKYKSQPGLWKHKQNCNHKTINDVETKSEISKLKEQIQTLTTIVTKLAEKPQCTNITNINIFLNEDCKNAINMKQFIEGIQFSNENFESANLLIASHLEHTAEIFQNHLNKMTIFERPIHTFTGEDANQLIAHYKNDNEWKSQSELKILDEIHRDYEGNQPNDSFVYYLEMFHKRRLEYFDKNHGGKRNYLGTNLKYTTYPEQQIDLTRKILAMVNIK